MPQSLTKNYIHITFATKNRYPFIDDVIEDELYKYLGGICKNLDSYPVKIGGYSDHVHILCVLSKSIPLSKLVEKLKSHSSKWIKEKGKKYEKFYWQKGYGAFSVDYRGVDIVSRYIENQKEHHQKINFQAEYKNFLDESGITYDERYMWD